MLYAQNDAGDTIAATGRRGETATCPGCGEQLRCKGSPPDAPPQVKDYWSHLAGPDCDPWYDPKNKMSEWHIGWQELVVRGKREVRIVRGRQWHRADIQAADRQVIEVQHGAISAGKVREREEFYGNMAWIFDTIEAQESGRLRLEKSKDWELPDSFRTFTWDGPWRVIAHCEKRIFFDLGNDLLLFAGGIEARAASGWGFVVAKARVVEWINDGPPGLPIDPRIALKEKREAERKAEERRRIEAEIEQKRIEEKRAAEWAAAELARWEAEAPQRAAEEERRTRQKIADEERRRQAQAEERVFFEERRRLQAQERARWDADGPKRWKIEGERRATVDLLAAYEYDPTEGAAAARKAVLKARWDQNVISGLRPTQCPACGDPLDGPPLMKRCADNHVLLKRGQH